MVNQSFSQGDHENPFIVLRHKRKHGNFGISHEFQPSYFHNQSMEIEFTDTNIKSVSNFYHQLRRPITPPGSETKTNFQPWKTELRFDHTFERPVKRSRNMISNNTTMSSKASRNNKLCETQYVCEDNSMNPIGIPFARVIPNEEKDCSDPLHSKPPKSISTQPWWKSNPKQNKSLGHPICNMNKFSNDSNRNDCSKNLACFVCQRQPTSDQIPKLDTISANRCFDNETRQRARQQQNSLLSYFKSTTIHTNNKVVTNNSKKSKSPQTSSTQNRSTTVVHNPLKMKSCSFCDRQVCQDCIHQCASCCKMYCSFCSTTSYESVRDAQTFCLECADSHWNDGKGHDKSTSLELEDMIID